MTSTYQFLSAGNSFVTFDDAGDILHPDNHGLFVADTRHVSRYLLRIEDLDLWPLRSGSLVSGAFEFFSTNQPSEHIRRQLVTIHRERTFGSELSDKITVYNFGDDPVSLTLVVEMNADFADIFEIRGLEANPDARQRIVHCSHGFKIEDRRRPEERFTSVAFEPQPDRLVEGHAEFKLLIDPRNSWMLEVGISTTSPVLEDTRPVPVATPCNDRRYLEETPVIETDDPALGRAFRQAIEDLKALEIPLDSGYSIPAAGIPWYQAIFGRDSLIASLQSMILGPNIARGTLHTLAAYQATDEDAFRDAEPGKMPHEVRFGELALSNRIPHARYYGTADATALWIMLLRTYSKWTGDLNIVSELLPRAERALEWIRLYGDHDGDGFVEYERKSPRGQLNQGWKDSRGSIRFADGTIARGPIALVEVQGYVYSAYVALSEIYEELGKHERAHELKTSAENLKSRIDDAFWMPDQGFYALALDGDKRQVDSITSNPGHLLWCGVPQQDRATKIADRLMAPDMFSGWGIRTMSTDMAGYNPVSYHNGSVWPHDNSLILAGVARYGLEMETRTLADALIDASTQFDYARLPELFCGFPRESTPFPVDYPTSCAPQAWASGAIVLLTQTLAGIAPDHNQMQVQQMCHGRELRLHRVSFRGRRYDHDDEASNCGPVS
jgi:glycogen debranching enzyme